MKVPEQITKVGLQIRRNWNKLFLFLCCLCAIQTTFPQKPLHKYDSNSQFASQINDGFVETILYPERRDDSKGSGIGTLKIIGTSNTDITNPLKTIIIQNEEQ